MRHNFEFEGGINSALPELMGAVLQGDEVGSRVGRTKELMHVGVSIGSPLGRYTTLPTRKVNLAAQIAETMWVLAGRNDVEWLSRYLPRAADYSDDGLTWRGGYGPRIRNWHGVDQLSHVVQLLRDDGTTRRAVISIYDASIDSAPGKDIPCNNWLHFTSRNGYIDLHVVIRSNDLMWGWSGINFFEWSSILEIVAGLAGQSVGSIHFSITSLHLYDKHWDKAAKIADDTGLPMISSPRFEMPSMMTMDDLIAQWFRVEEDIRRGVTGNENLVDFFPEPLLRSWLRVLQWWWSGDETYLEPLAGMSIGMAAMMGIHPKRPVPEPADPFVAYVTNLHNEKHAAYGDSWKRRGEMLGIMANIARKIDRLGVSGAGDTATDTAIDLLVYLAKYHIWLLDPNAANGTQAPNKLIKDIAPVSSYWAASVSVLEKDLAQHFDRLERMVMSSSNDRADYVLRMAGLAKSLARKLWEADQK